MALVDILALRTIVNEHELYEITYDIYDPEYFTSQSYEVVVPNGHPFNSTGADITYKPVPAVRESVESNSRLNGGKLEIGFPATSTDFRDVLVSGGVDQVTIKIIRGFGDPVTAPDQFQRYWYIGTLAEIQVAESVLIATFRDVSYNLENTELPRIRAQRLCNHDVYDDNCGFTENPHQFDVVNVLNNGRTLEVTGTEVASQLSEVIGDSPGDYSVDPPIEPVTGYYTLGKLRPLLPYSAKIFVLSHTRENGKTYMHLQSAFLGEAGAPVEISWGCDKRIKETCIPKFKNRLNAHAVPDQPNKNPVLYRVFRQRS